jgi:hypothetical protein
MWFVDHLHQNGIGVLIDWVPSHFPSDEHGLGYFDGTYLYEHLDARRRVHPDWGSLSFNFGRNEVRAFLLSSARNWIETYHIDGLRVDAVASMLYLDYSRGEGQWVPNAQGGKEDLDAISFMRQTNTALYTAHPDIVLIAEESTAWPMVARRICHSSASRSPTVSRRAASSSKGPGPSSVTHQARTRVVRIGGGTWPTSSARATSSRPTRGRIQPRSVRASPTRRPPGTVAGIADLMSLGRRRSAAGAGTEMCRLHRYGSTKLGSVGSTTA